MEESQLISQTFLDEHKIKVLLVDDQRIVAEDIKRNLASSTDIEFHYCNEPTEALQTAINLQPTVILQDLIMPEVDGMTLVRYYQGHPKTKDIPVIVLSSREEGVTKAEAFEKGANDYMVKPADKVELIARIRYHSRAYINLIERNEAFAALTSELNKAANYVKSLLPKQLTDGPIRSNWSFKPSAKLGGDIFGYNYIDDKHFAMYLLDVSGHGVGSALLSVSAQNILRQQSFGNIDYRDPVSVIDLLNKTFQMSQHGNLFFTLWYGVFNLETRELTYTSGGHPPACLMEEGKDIQYLAAEGIVVGALDIFQYNSQTVKIENPADIYIYSDGAFEVMDEHEKVWTFEEMAAYLKHNKADDDSEIFELHGVLIERGGKPILDDDFSIVKIKLS